MLYFNQNKKNCTGCSACYSVCPNQCIKMISDDEGYLYPEANKNACINCGLCERVCPMQRTLIDNDYPKRVIAATSKDEKIWKRSTSGGAFSEICKVWADDDTLIVGAAWNGLKVHHIGVLGYENIAPLCKSKYISSPVEDTFKEIKKHLNSGKKAIFCGCPCQVDGLKSYLRKTYDNLLTIDLICHGQGSPFVFEECIKYMSNKLGENIESYEFRSKRDVFEMEYLSSIKSTSKEYFVSQDPYIQLFIGKLALRICCGENCRYHDIRRQGDLTIADCKGLTKLYPDLIGSIHNYSTIVSNSDQGEKCLQMIEKTMDCRPGTVENVIEYNPFFAKHSWRFLHRDEFFVDFRENPQCAIEKWAPKEFHIKNNDLIYNVFHYSPKLLWPLFGKIIGLTKKVIKNR